jgi:1-deoxy-D-xylulose-5-phosphate synthase
LGPLLNRVKSPDDIKKMNPKKLRELAAEIRELIINTVSVNGGHLASNLGVVELTLALHYVFDFKKDRLIWDVGHQSYTHKLITGRKDSFHTLRQYRGISGFPKIQESIYDHYNTGHSSTSISAALGMAVARDQQEEDYYIIPVCGDGALTAGLALEGLNQAGHLRKKMILVLNDNEMSIGKNVGGISGYLKRIISGQFYIRFHQKLKKLLQKIPYLGRPLLSFARASEHLLKRMFVPGMLFEELGYRYIGPEDGHNIPTLIQTLEKAKTHEGPVILHVVTRKGKGYKPAEDRMEAFHGAAPFDVETGEFRKPGKPTPPSYTSVFGNTLCELAETDPKVVAITAAMRDGTGLKQFSELFPDRFHDVGIAEQHAVVFASGLALQGLKPVVAIYSTFLQRAYDQLVHDVSLMKLPITFAIDRGGIVGADGPTHQGVYDISYLRMIPNFIVAAPRDENELRHLLFTGIQSGMPFAIRYPRGNGIGISLDSPLREILPGTAEIMRHGSDILMIAVGRMVYNAIEAARKLSTEGIEATVIDARYIKPLDVDLIKSEAEKIGRVITIEDNVLAGGFGSLIAETLVDNKLDGIPILRIGLPDKEIEHGEVNILDSLFGLDPASIYRRSREFIRTTRRKRRTKQIDSRPGLRIIRGE